MSLKRRIAAAAAVAVAAVAVAVAITSYLSTRSRLVGEVKQELRERVQPLLGSHGGGGRNGQPQDHHHDEEAPPAPQFGGASGYFQFVHPGGTVFVPGGGARLPVDARVLEIARTGKGSFFTSATVNGDHLQLLTIGDPYDHYAIQVALPLDEVDDVLSGLVLPYALLIAGGIVLAALLGLGISRSALRPIERFVARTERVTKELEHPARLEETDAVELRRLASSFNQTLDALERSIEAQRQLVADASHELRTPIAALRSNIQIFLDSGRLPAHEREGLQESILAELDELTQIVADVLELAQGSAPSFRVEPVELDTIVSEAVDRAQRRAADLRFELDLEPTVVDGVNERIARAVANVIDNARKWSPPDGEIEVRVKDGTLTVRDHGPGFGEKDLPHVFDRFYRADQARRMPGSGLGLAIVKQTARAHGGEAVASNAPDGGAIVSVSFTRSLARTAGDQTAAV